MNSYEQKRHSSILGHNIYLYAFYFLLKTAFKKKPFTCVNSLSATLLHIIHFIALVIVLLTNCCIVCSYILQNTIFTTQVHEYLPDGCYHYAFIQLSALVMCAIVSHKQLACSAACHRLERNSIA